MIFPTLEEHNRVFNIIQNYERFQELKNEDAFVIECMYECLRAVENVCDEYDEESSEYEALEEAYTMVTATIADVYVSITDSDSDYHEE